MIVNTFTLVYQREASKQTKCQHQAAAAAAKSLQPCPTVCDPIDGSPPGSPIPVILQARTLEWVAIAFSNRVCYKKPWLLIQCKELTHNVL